MVEEGRKELFKLRSNCLAAVTLHNLLNSDNNPDICKRHGGGNHCDNPPRTNFKLYLWPPRGDENPESGPGTYVEITITNELEYQKQMSELSDLTCSYQTKDPSRYYPEGFNPINYPLNGWRTEGYFNLGYTGKTPTVKNKKTGSCVLESSGPFCGSNALNSNEECKAFMARVLSKGNFPCTDIITTFKFQDTEQLSLWNDFGASRLACDCSYYPGSACENIEDRFGANSMEDRFSCVNGTLSECQTRESGDCTSWRENTTMVALHVNPAGEIELKDEL